MGFRFGWARAIWVFLLVFGLSELDAVRGAVQAAETRQGIKAGGGGPLPADESESKHAVSGHGESPTGEEPVNPLRFEPTLAFYTLVVFIALLAVLSKYAWGPLAKGLQAREEHFQHVLAETERARNESEALLAEHRRLMAKAGEEVRGILEKARQDAAAAAEQIVKQAQAEADAVRERARRDIAAARDQALGEIWDKTAAMVVQAAGRVLMKSLDEAEHRRLFDAALAELPALAQGSGGARG